MKKLIALAIIGTMFPGVLSPIFMPYTYASEDTVITASGDVVAEVSDVNVNLDISTNKTKNIGNDKATDLDLNFNIASPREGQVVTIDLFNVGNPFKAGDFIYNGEVIGTISIEHTNNIPTDFNNIDPNLRPEDSQYSYKVKLTLNKNAEKFGEDPYDGIRVDVNTQDPILIQTLTANKEFTIPARVSINGSDIVTKTISVSPLTDSDEAPLEQDEFFGVFRSEIEDGEEKANKSSASLFFGFKDLLLQEGDRITFSKGASSFISFAPLDEIKYNAIYISYNSAKVVTHNEHGIANRTEFPRTGLILRHVEGDKERIVLEVQSEEGSKVTAMPEESKGKHLRSGFSDHAKAKLNETYFENPTKYESGVAKHFYDAHVTITRGEEVIFDSNVRSSEIVTVQGSSVSAVARKNFNVTVEYLSGDQVIPNTTTESVLVRKPAGTEFEVPVKDIPGYRYVGIISGGDSLNGTLGEGDIHFKLNYEKLPEETENSNNHVNNEELRGSVIVMAVDEWGREIAESESVDNFIGKDYSIDPSEEIVGMDNFPYKLSTNQPDRDKFAGIHTKDDITLSVVYIRQPRKNRGLLELHAYDEGDGSFIDDQIFDGEIGEEYNNDDVNPEVHGNNGEIWELSKNQPERDKFSGVYTKEKIIIKVYYIRKDKSSENNTSTNPETNITETGSVTFEMKEEITNMLLKTEVMTGNVGDVYSKEIPEYFQPNGFGGEVYKLSTNQPERDKFSGAYTKDNIVVPVMYEKMRCRVYLNEWDENGEEIDRETTWFVGISNDYQNGDKSFFVWNKEKYKIQPYKEIIKNGKRYILNVNQPDRDKFEGACVDHEDMTVNLYYTEQELTPTNTTSTGSVTFRIVDGIGRELKESEILTGNIGEKYSKEIPELVTTKDGYVYVLDKNQPQRDKFSGTYTNDNLMIDVRYALLECTLNMITWDEKGKKRATHNMNVGVDFSYIDMKFVTWNGWNYKIQPRGEIFLNGEKYVFNSNQPERSKFEGICNQQNEVVTVNVYYTSEELLKSSNTHTNSSTSAGGGGYVPSVNSNTNPIVITNVNTNDSSASSSSHSSVGTSLLVPKLNLLPIQNKQINQEDKGVVENKNGLLLDSAPLLDFSQKDIKGETYIKKYVKELPQTGASDILEKVGIVSKFAQKFIETNLPSLETFKLAGTYSSDLQDWLNILPEVDRNASQYIILPSQGLIMPVNSVEKSDITYDRFINGKSENFHKYLETGAVELPGTSTRGYGEIGNKVIAGHSSFWKNQPGRYKTHFQKIMELKEGEEIWVYQKDENGKFVRYAYNVTESYNTASNDISVLKPTDHSQLTLITCTPIGGIAGRWAVKAKFSYKY